MTWKAWLCQLEQDEKWEEAMLLAEDVLASNPRDADAYVRIIFLYWFVWLESSHPKAFSDELQGLIRKYYQASVTQYSNNAEYLFFVGLLISVTDWPFAVVDDYTGSEQNQVTWMLRKAHELEPDNPVYKLFWNRRLQTIAKASGQEAEEHIETESAMAKAGLNAPKQAWEMWLKDKGGPGRYVLEWQLGKK